MTEGTALRSTSTTSSEVAARAAVYSALGDVTRLSIVDALMLSDRSPRELGDRFGLPTNLLTFHLNVLEEAGLIVRTASQGDARRRYLRLRVGALPSFDRPHPLDTPVERVLFVCIANSARSQLAAHLWQARTGRPALSAGTAPAAAVHPLARAVAGRGGLDLDDASPTGLDQMSSMPDLVVSVCDRAYESTIEFDVPTLHWSVPDPVGGGPEAFTSAFEELTDRVEWLARAVLSDSHIHEAHAATEQPTS